MVMKYRNFLIVGSFFVASFAALLSARTQIAENNQVISDLQDYPVEAPKTVPPLSQNSIDIALEMFNIKVPAGAKYPVLNPNLEDRGISSRLPWSEMITVEIGPSAFLSWSLLGSTLAHELEVHCQQNFTLINIMDALGMNGTQKAERAAYLHEISNAKRFGLDVDQQQLIRDTMDYYYAVDQSEANYSISLASKKIRNTLGRWLAKPLIMVY